MFAYARSFGSSDAGRTADQHFPIDRSGKRWASRLQVLLQADRILLPDTDEARQLVDELFAFEIKIAEDGNERYGAFKVGKHDDLVVALGLAVLDDPPRRCSATIHIYEPLSVEDLPLGLWL